MQNAYVPTPISNSEHATALFRRRTLISGFFVGASLALAACGSSGSTATLDTAKIERAIAHSSMAQRGQRARVSCPSGVPQKEGLEFSCKAIVGSVSTRFVVVEQDGSGHVHYEAP